MLFVIVDCLGPRKLFTKDEKVLLNGRVPDLAVASSVSYITTFAIQFVILVQILFLAYNFSKLLKSSPSSEYYVLLMLILGKSNIISINYTLF